MIQLGQGITQRGHQYLLRCLEFGSSMLQHIQWLNDEATVEETGHATAAAVLPMFLGGETPSKLIMLSFFWPKTDLGKR